MPPVPQKAGDWFSAKELICDDTGTSYCLGYYAWTRSSRSTIYGVFDRATSKQMKSRGEWMSEIITTMNVWWKNVLALRVKANNTEMTVIYGISATIYTSQWSFNAIFINVKQNVSVLFTVAKMYTMKNYDVL